ncbi:MAG: glycerate kinase [Microvirga sp.]|jgi:hydroxypyruvate reductase|nr:glycerate kinase [Microvirga sp.]
MTPEIARRREVLRRAFEAAVAAAHPSGCLAGHLPEPPGKGRLILLAAGKAGASMAAVAERFYRERGISPGRLAGLAVTRHGYGEPAGAVPVIEAGHPVPDREGVEATLRALALAEGATADDLVLVLLSGGGSANWIAPAGMLTLAEKQGITRALLRSGANIGEINTLRKHLSRIKGGRLARVSAPARVLTLAISDVPRDDPAVIASGPTVPDPSTLADAREIVRRRGVPLPPSAEALLKDPANESPKPGDPAFANTEFRIVARPADAIAAAAMASRAAGYDPLVLGADLEGEAREVAAEHGRLAREAAAAGRRAAIVSGGELTVTIRGSGRGGPNQEYALALALALDGAPGIAALAADTDGTDGGAGSADDPAGAIIDETTLARARALGLDAAALMTDNDSTNFFERLSDLVTCGPTRTNVNDCRIILVG